MKQSSWPDVAAINQKNYYTYAILPLGCSPNHTVRVLTELFNFAAST